MSKLLEIVEKYGLPKDMYFQKLFSELFSDFIIINKGEYMFFFKDEKIDYMKDDIICTIKEKDIEKYLSKSKRYLKILRRKKLNQIT